MHSCCMDKLIGYFVANQNKMCYLPSVITTHKSIYFPSLFIKRMSLISKVNFQKEFSENYKRISLVIRVNYMLANTAEVNILM